MRSFIFVACLAVPLCVSARGIAQPAMSPPDRPQSDAKTDQARELHVKGAALFEQGQYDKAEAAFLAAWALKKHYQIASNLGACEMKLGKYRDAAEHLAFFLREQPSTGSQDDRKRTQALFDEARAKVGAVVLKVNVVGAAVTVDGREIGAAPILTEVYVDPGTRTLVATHGSYKDARQVIEAKAGGTERVTLVLTPPETTVPPPVPARSKVPAVVLGTVAGAAAVAGVALLVDGANKRADSHVVSDAIRSAHHSCVTGAANFDARCAQLDNTGRASDKSHDAGVGVLIGAGAAAAGMVTYLLWPARAPKPPSALRIAPTVSTTSAGMFLSGAF